MELGARPYTVIVLGAGFAVLALVLRAGLADIARAVRSSSDQPRAAATVVARQTWAPNPTPAPPVQAPSAPSTHDLDAHVADQIRDGLSAQIPEYTKSCWKPKAVGAFPAQFDVRLELDASGLETARSLKPSAATPGGPALAALTACMQGLHPKPIKVDGTGSKRSESGMLHVP